MARSPSQLDRDARFTLGLTLALLLLSLGLACVPALWRAWRIARRPLPDPIPGGTRLVFGKRLVHDQPDADYRLRLDRAVRLMASAPTTPTIVLGGRYAEHETSEAEAGRHYLEAHRDTIAADAPILLEDASRDTLMNLRNARELLSEADSDPVVFVSSRYHLARCSRIGSNLGIEHSLCPAEDAWTWTPHNAARLLIEAVFLLWFDTGRGWARLTSNRRMLERIS